jgi:hypothetical protein
MLDDLLRAYFEEEQLEDPHFQYAFKRWIRRTRRGQFGKIRAWTAAVKNTWPTEADVTPLCELVAMYFRPEPPPVAFLHLILLLTPAYDELKGTPWSSDDDPVRLPSENVGRFLQLVQHWAHKSQPEVVYRLLQPGPPALGVTLHAEQAKIYQARAIAVPYPVNTPEHGIPPVQPIAFDSDDNPCDELCKESIKAAAWMCRETLYDGRWWEIIQTGLCGPFGTMSWILVVLGMLFYMIFGLGGGAWFALFLWPWPAFILWWGFVVGCVCLGSGLLWSLLWSGVRGVLPRKQRGRISPHHFYFLVFVEETDDTRYEEPLEGNSLGLAFFCACVGARIPWMQRPPAWARHLASLMTQRRVIACAGLQRSTNKPLQKVEVIPKLHAIQNPPKEVADAERPLIIIFSLHNCGEILTKWNEWNEPPLKWVRLTRRRFRAQDTSRGMRVWAVETVEQIISHVLTPSYSHCMVARVAIIALLTLALTSAVLSQQRYLNPRIQLRVDTDLVWGPIRKSGGAIIMSNPPVYRFAHRHDRLDSRIPLTGKKEELVLSLDEYTGMGEAMAHARISKIFFLLASNKYLETFQSRDKMDDGKLMRNIIILGGWRSSNIATKLLKENPDYLKNLPYQHYDGAIHMHDTIKGIRESYSATYNADGDVTNDYGLITKVSNPFDQHKSIILILSGIHSQGTEAAGKFVTSLDHLGILKDKLGNSSPRYFQVLFEVLVYEGRPQDPKYVAHRVIP